MLGDLDFVFSITIPLTPPSGNHYVKHTKQGIHYITGEARAFQDAVAIIAQGRSLQGRQGAKSKLYAVQVKFYLGKGQKLDTDNCAKVVLDGLVKAGVIHSDAAVMDVSLHKRRDPANPRTEIRVAYVTGMEE